MPLALEQLFGRLMIKHSINQKDGREHGHWIEFLQKVAHTAEDTEVNVTGKLGQT